MQQEQQSFMHLAAPILILLTAILLSEMLFCNTEIFRLKLEKN